MLSPGLFIPRFPAFLPGSVYIITSYVLGQALVGVSSGLDYST